MTRTASPTNSKAERNELEAPLINRATQSRYPPGSTFKVVTAAAALDSGTITPETTINAPGALIDEGHELNNDFAGLGKNHPRHGADQLGQHLVRSGRRQGRRGHPVRIHGTLRLQHQAGDRPALRTAPGERHRRPRKRRTLLTANDPIDIERVAIGQERLLVTPLQNAEVAAAVANKGHADEAADLEQGDRPRRPRGRKRLDPSEYGQPISEKTAEELTTAMEGVVSEGTGTNAAISGVPVAGKTGTAETPGNEACGGGEEENQAWFMGFAPADEPKIAIAVSIECTRAVRQRRRGADLPRSRGNDPERGMRCG